MPVMENGDVVPHFYKTAFPKRAWDGDLLNEIKLLRGEIKQIIYPDDKESRNKRSIEYVVYAQRNANDTKSTQEFRCVVATQFGGVADKLNYTLRKDDSDQQKKDGIGTGSKVIFMCINGEKHRGIIISGVRDDKDEAEKKAKDKGHYLSFTFNGVNMFVDKDGQMQVNYGGKTNIDGKANDDVDDNVKNTRFTFLKNGSWVVGTQDKDDVNNNKFDQFFLINNSKRAIFFQARKRWQVVVKEGPAEIQAPKGVHLISADGDNASATDFMLLGTSYRDAQKELNNKLKNFLQNAATQLTTAGGKVAGPFLAAAAGADIIAAAQLLLQASQAIDAFENKAAQNNGFLSKQHKLD